MGFLKPRLQPGPRAGVLVALHLKRDYLLCGWLLSLDGAQLTASVQRIDTGLRWPPLVEGCGDRDEALGRFAELLKGGPEHLWEAFYVGPELAG